MGEGMDNSRRDFLLKVAAGAAGAAVSGVSARAQAPGAPRNVTVTNPRLRPTDFTYVGSFRCEHDDVSYGGTGMGWNPAGNSGAGSLLLAGNTSNYRNTIVEMIPPNPAISPTRTRLDLPTARWVRTIADPTGGQIAALGGGMWLRGVTAFRLPNGDYKIAWGFSKYFNASNINYYGLGYCDLDGSNVRGGWRLTGKMTQRVAANLSTVPQAWADEHTGGRSLIGGGIDYQIMAASCGGHSAFFWAPWVDAPANYAPPPNTELTVRTAADYPMSEYADPSGQQMKYPAGIEEAGWKPPHHNFFWTSDSHGGVQYVVTSDGRAGFVVPGAVAGLFSSYVLSQDMWAPASNTNPTFFPHGVWPDGTQMYYAAATAPAHGQVAGKFRCALFMYDPSDYVEVFAGRKAPHQVTAYEWKDVFRDLSLNGTVGVADGGVGAPRPVGWPNQNWNVNGNWRFMGSAYDPLTRRLYILQNEFYSNGIATYPGVHVYQVA